MALDEREQIKNKIDLIELISEHVTLKKAGRNFKALCPFHSEKTPSFMVSPERQIFKCFGCGAGGDAFSFMMRVENMDFGEALRTLAKRAGVKLKSYRPSEKEKEKQLLFEINQLAGEYYHYLLLKHPAGRRAREYVLRRGIKQVSLEKFKIGYAPDLWEGLQDYLVKKKKYSPESLFKAGLVIESNRYRSQGKRYYDRFRHRLVFPLHDHRGNVCGFSGRVIVHGQKEAKYINSPETTVYHKSNLLYGLFENQKEIKKEEKAILVEGELDVISSSQVGVANVLAIKGSALSENQVTLLKRYTDNLIMALDKDLAGDQAARRGIEIADAVGMMIKVVRLKGGKDPDEVAQKEPKLWRKQVNEAVGIYDYFIDSAIDRFGDRSAEAKSKVGRELVPILNKINDRIVQSHYVSLLADRLEVEPDSILAQMRKENRINRQKTAVRERFLPVLKKPVEINQREVYEEYLLALPFQAGKWELLLEKKITDLVKTPRFARLLEVLVEYHRLYKTQDSQRLAKMLPDELVDAFNKLYLFEMTDYADNEERFREEYQKVVNRLSKIDLKEKITENSRQIKELENQQKLTAQQQKTLANLEKQTLKLTQKLAEFDGSS